MISTSPEGPRFTRSTLPAKTGRPPSTSTPKRFSTPSPPHPDAFPPGSPPGRAGEPPPRGLPREERRHGRLDLPALEKEKAGKPHRVLPGEPGEHLPGRPARVPPSLSFHPERIVATRCQGTSPPPSSGTAPLCQARRASSLALTGPGPESAANGFRERERMEAPDASPHVSL